MHTYQTAVERRLKDSIDATYPRGWYVAVAGDQVLAASADFHGLEDSLRGQGRDPRDVLVVEAGIANPTQVTIFV